MLSRLVIRPAPIHVISELQANDRGFDLSGERDVVALFEAEDRHFWHRSRNRIIASRLRKLGVRPGARVLDVGCGAGCVASHLSREGYVVTGVDGHRRLLEVAARRAPELTLWQHDLRGGTEALPAHDFDAACLFDVIEHLDDPVSALEGALACVRPGALVVGTVPALMSLWSSIDAHAGHKLRYTTSTLREALMQVRGASVVELAPFNRTLVPLLWVQRKLVGRKGDAEDAEKNLSVPPAPVNGALATMVLLEHALAPVLDRTRLEGSSIWFALRRAG